MAKRRVVVTGLGVVSCLGQDTEKFYDQLLAGKSGISNIERFPLDDHTTRIAGEIKDFSCEDLVDRKLARRADESILYGLVGGKKALAHAGLDEAALSQFDKRRCGVLIGSGMGGMRVFSEQVQAMLEGTYKRVSPFFIPYVITNMPGALLGIDLGFMGPNYSVSTACATGSYALHLAAEHIRSGEADLMVAGGVEGGITPISLAGFISVKALSRRNEDPQKASRPWDKDRDGFVLGEGCGVLVLESLESAQKRGATILAEYLGGAFSCDAFHMTQPEPNGEGIALCLEKALSDAGIQAEDVDYVNAHATSTPLGDMGELNAVHRALKGKKVTINATKSMIGHCLGAAGGLEAVVCVQAISRGVVHPTINLDHPDEGCERFDLPREAKEMKVNVAVNNSFGFGGHNSANIFGRYTP
ncbi:MAG: beta-ketoacyl-[acyl-carrier-protein] synthase II [Waddliaceae bacterium]|nr:beta-ketoacyl-[acyl-carrier-protein] synthase II [Waddliaceae bacterium]